MITDQSTTHSYSESLLERLAVKGRDTRLTYLSFTVFLTVILLIVESARSDIAEFIVYMLFLVPMIRVTARRLHDFGTSGWWMLLILIPYVNIVFSLVLIFKKGDVGNNQYGHAPEYRYM